LSGCKGCTFEFNIWYSRRNAVFRSDTEEVMLGMDFLHVIFFFISQQNHKSCPVQSSFETDQTDETDQEDQTDETDQDGCSW
jgi:hypothetical protein